MISLETLTTEVHDIEPLPNVVLKLSQLAQEADPDIMQAILAIRYDQALTTRVLRYANSPMAGSRYPIKSVKDAVIRLGFATVLEIAVGSHVHPMMSGALPHYGLNEAELWQHSKAAALAAELLQNHMSRKLPTSTFTATLLHDIGKLVLGRHLNGAIVQAIEKCSEEYNLTHFQAEQEILGFTHATVGACLATKWNLGETIAHAIENHHDVEAANGIVCDVVQTCNLIAKTVGCGLGFEGLNLSANTDATVRLQISRETFEFVCAEVASHLADISVSDD